ncbi:NINE protein [Corynebacterium sp. AOP40-9SA-29]|uniref:NINE protein n=1 Tax=Corynebacterium sp. AOP40-9SA-29 TaxID=3457677 RepID=UPI004033A18D
MTDSSKPSDSPFPDSSDNSDAPQVPETPEAPDAPETPAGTEAPKGRWSGMDTAEAPADQQTQAYGHGYGQSYSQSYSQGYNQEQPMPGYPGYSESAGSADGASATQGLPPYPGGSSQAGANAAGASYPGAYPGAQQGGYQGTYQGGYSAGYPGPQGYGAPPLSRKSKVAAALFAFFLGGFGAHNFYIGNKGRAIAQLIIMVVSWVLMIGAYTLVFVGLEAEAYTSMAGTVYYESNDAMVGSGAVLLLLAAVMMLALCIWALVEFVLILVGSGRYGRDAEGYPLS